MSISDKKRIIFLDMMRALAVLMMVEGHTVDALLSEEFRNFNSTIFNLWFSIRGFTAPIFMFTSGVVFTYLLRLNKHSFFENPRVKKGFFRFLTLVLIGYLLRYPTYTFFDFRVVSREQWIVFFTVDALHLIGFGLLFILILALISEKLKVSDTIIFGIGALFFFISYSITENTNWLDYFPWPIAGYFFHKTGSYFPFFPWAGYVISGGILGSYLARHLESCGTKKFSFQLFYIGSTLLALAFSITLIDKNYFNGNGWWTNNLYIVSLRMGLVLVLNSIMSLIALNIRTIPELVKQVGRHTLLIYAVHVVILYGSAWIPGLSSVMHKQLSILQSIISAVVMVFLMLLMVIVIEKIKHMKKNKLVSVEA